MVDLREVLIREYAKRSNRNGNYSIPAYAKHLGIDQSQLTKIFNQQLDISKKMGQRILSSLNLKHEDIFEYWTSRYQN